MIIGRWGLKSNYVYLLFVEVISNLLGSNLDSNIVMVKCYKYYIKTELLVLITTSKLYINKTIQKVFHLFSVDNIIWNNICTPYGIYISLKIIQFQ